MTSDSVMSRLHLASTSSLIRPVTTGGIAQCPPPFDPLLHRLPSSRLSFPPSLGAMHRPVLENFLSFFARPVVVRPRVRMRAREGSAALETAFHGILPSEGAGASTHRSFLVDTTVGRGDRRRRVGRRPLPSSGLVRGDLIRTLAGMLVPAETEDRVQQMHSILP